MARILIVDDVRELCEELSWALLSNGHTITYATGGKEGIYRGIVERPQVLIADWLLREQLTGLDVVEAIAVAVPTIRRLLITGFATRDLRTDALQLGVFEVLEKPFSPDQLRTAINAALHIPDGKDLTSQIAVFERGECGEVLYANPQTEALFGLQPCPGAPLPIEGAVFLKSLTQWAELPVVNSTIILRGRYLPERDTHFFVALDGNKPGLLPLAHRILGVLEEPLPPPLFAGHALVVDSEEAPRRIATNIIRQFHQNCHSAESVEEAVRVFAHDPDIRVVFLDAELPDANPLTLAKHLRALRPEITVIGTGKPEGRAPFTQVGIDRFLKKPWSVTDFLELFQRGRTPTPPGVCPLGAWRAKSGILLRTGRDERDG